MTIRKTGFALALALAGVTQGLFADSLKKPTEGNDWDSSVTKKVSVSRNAVHTFWVTGLSKESSVSSLDVICEYEYKEGGETCEGVIWPTRTAETYDADGNLTGMYVLLSDEDWEDAPSSKNTFSFSCIIDGWYDEEVKANNNFTFGHANGDANFPYDAEDQEEEEKIPYGSTEGTAQPIKPAAQLLPGTTYTSNAFAPQYENENYLDGYFFSLDLVAGQKYIFGIVTNEPNAGVQVEIYNKTDAADLTLAGQPYDKYWPECMMSVAIVATRTGKHYVNVRSDSRNYSLRCVPIQARALADHAQTPIAVSAEEPQVVSDPFKPGYAVDPANGCYDAIIDDKLFKITGFKAGENYIFRTEGAKTNLIMRLYDGKGVMINGGENRFRGLTNFGFDHDVQLAWSVTAADVTAKAVYVGIAQNLADGATKSDDPGDVKLFVERVTPENETTPVTAVPGDVIDPREAPGVRPSAPRSLGKNAWVNTFVMAARANTEYAFKIRPSGAGASVTNLLPICATAYTQTSNGKRTVLATAIEEIGPFTEGAFGFRTGTTHGQIYIDVAVSDEGPQGAGKGLDFGPYELCGFAVSDIAATGFLEINMKGAPFEKMAWKILKRDGKTPSPSEVYYAPGTGVTLPVGTYTIGAQTVTGFAKPNSAGIATLTVEPWGQDQKSVTYLYYYTDTFDPGDDDPYVKPTKISPTATKPATGDRTLWITDPADWFVISAAAGNYYRVEFTEAKGDCCVKAFGPDMTKVDYQPITNNTPMVHTEAIQFCATVKGNYYVKVCHGNAAGVEFPEGQRTDSSYTFKASMYAPGQVKLTKTEYSVKEDAAYVDVGVSRTGDGGTVRVKFRTVAITAQPNTEYYPTNGVITWFAKDKKERKIRVNLIPDIVPTWAASNLEFKVQFETFTAGERKYDDEFIPSFTTTTKTTGSGASRQTVTTVNDTALIKLTETAKKTPGSITADYMIDGKPGVFENPKKPTVTVKRGETLTLLVRRDPGASGANGAVGVEVSTKPGTAKPGIDYNDIAAKTHVWEDASTNGVCTYTVLTRALPDDHTASKAFTVTLKALSARPEDPKAKLDKATLTASSVTVTILNPNTRKVTDYFKDKATAAALKAEGINGLKESKAGTWVISKDGRMTCVTPGDLSFTLVGPGRFSFVPTIAPGGTMSWSMGSGKAAQGGECITGSNHKIYVPAGTQTLKITATAGCYLNVRTDGAAYEWLQLPVATMLPYLVDKSVVAAGEVEFRFDRSLTNATSGVGYRVYALSEGACWTNVTYKEDGVTVKSQKVVKYKLGEPETEILADKTGAFKTNVWFDAKVNKGKWTFRVDSFFVGGTVTNAPKSAWSFTVADTSKLPEGAKLADTRITGVDALGYTIDGAGSAGTADEGLIYLRRLVKVNFPVGAAGSTVSKVTGTLPSGVSLKQVEVVKGVKQWYLTGTPSKAGKFPLVLRETAKYDNKASVAGTTTAFTLVVADSGLAEGKFGGLAFANGPGNNEIVPAPVANRTESIAQVQITAASSGKLSASVKIAGKSYSFTDTGYKLIKYLGPKTVKPEDDPEGPYEFTGELTQSLKVGKDTVVNRMIYTCLDVPKTNTVEWTNAISVVRLEMASLNGAKFTGEVCRDNTTIKEWVTEAAKFAGYYTLALAPEEPEDKTGDVPHGNGYLTLTLDAKGKAKLAGVTADGTSYSASSVAATILLGEDNEPMIRVPIYAFKSTYLVGGWLTVRFPEGAAPKKNLCDYDDPNVQVPVVEYEPGREILLINGNPAVTYYGADGYTLRTIPVGGWYDKVINLQRYYRSADYTNNAFSVDMAHGDDFTLLREAMQLQHPDYYFVAAASANGLAVDLTGNTLAVDKQKLVKKLDEAGKATKWYDWPACVNPANVSVKFARATGIVNGTCDLWYEGYKSDSRGNLTLEQLKYGGCKHQGVLLLSYDPDVYGSCFGTDATKAVWSAGTVIVPQKIGTRTWNASFRFNIVATPVELPVEGPVKEN